jgi:hypothetical protein
VAFRVDLRLQSPIIIICRKLKCVWTTEQSRKVEQARSLEKTPVFVENNLILIQLAAAEGAVTGCGWEAVGGGRLPLSVCRPQGS